MCGYRTGTFMEKQIVITDSYMMSVSKLNKQERKLATNTIKQMRKDISLPSLKVHALDKEKCDTKFRSARVNTDLRIIFMHEGDYCTLLYIAHHDEAYAWCEGKYFRKTDFGASYIFDVIQQEKVMKKVEQENDENDSSEEPAVLEGKISKKDLMRLGINEIHANNLLHIKSEDIFMDYIAIFPEELQEALFDVYTESKEFDVIYNELFVDQAEEEAVDVSLSMLHKDTRRRFYVTQSMEELEYLMENEEFEKWTIFLHPSQERLVSINASGPVLIEGGPGTGKTVLGMHRAAYLSKNIFRKEDDKKILFCTFSRKLAKNISTSLEHLYEQQNIPMNVDVLGVDSFIQQQLVGAGEDLKVDMVQFEKLMKRVYNSKKWDFSFDFYQYEYFQVIERYGILKLEEYLSAQRKGMGTRLTENQRRSVWEYFRALFRKQRELGISTFVNRAEKLESLLASGKLLPMYDSIIIDEAQDLEPAKLRLLNKCVKSAKNGLMILSDFNQRIYNLLTWKGDTDINIVGRTYHLVINYRTTKEISDYASMIFFRGQEKNDYMKSYKSIVKGNEPVVKGFINEEKQWNAIVATVTDLVSQGIALNKICVVFPFTSEKEAFVKVLEKKNIKHLFLQNDVIPSEASSDTLCLCLTKGIKGLEFQFVVMASSEKVGKGLAGRHIADDMAKKLYQKQVDCERYVAATRARDGLLVTYVEE